MPEKHAMVRILSDLENRVAEGAGILVSKRHILTCAHVVDPLIAGQEEAVHIDFPLLDGSPALKANVAIMIHPVEFPVVGQAEDICVLETAAGNSLPAEAEPARFTDPEDHEFYDRPVKILGFPAGSDSGDWVDGRLKDLVGTGRVQMDHELASKTVARGFSGAAMWDRDNRVVVGMTVCRNERDGKISAYMIPVVLLAAVCKDLDLDEDENLTCTGDGVDVGKEPGHGGLCELVRPGGAMEAMSPFYIRRDADEEVLEEVTSNRGVVTVRGPRQTGKTSLVQQIYVHLKNGESDCRPVFLDFQSIPESEFENINTVWRTVAAATADQLGLDGWTNDGWKSETGYDQNMSRFLKRFVFAEDDAPLLVCLDEVDRVFSHPVQTDFFASIRAFYNRGAHDPDWKRIRWLLCTSSEPAFFIRDLDQSPFNIGARVGLGAFTREETADFVRRHELSLDGVTIDRIMNYVGGRPYLVHLLLYHMARKEQSAWADFFNSRTAGGGIFKSHLKRYAVQFQKEKDLAEAMRRVIAGKGCRSLEMTDRLEAAGLAREDDDGRLIPACGLYAEYFKRVV